MPLHPAIVHLPIGLAIVMPILALLATVAIRRNWFNRKLWFLVTLAQLVVLGAGLAALQTGENEEDKIEQYVTESQIHHHEEKGEAFLWAAGLTLVASIAALVIRASGGAMAARIITIMLAVATTAFALDAGRSGGELVYQHGAARAYQSQENK